MVIHDGLQRPAIKLFGFWQPEIFVYAYEIQTTHKIIRIGGLKFIFCIT